MEEDFFSAFKLAIEREQEAYDFYTYLAAKTDDEELKEFLLRLARDESIHKKDLLALYASMSKKEGP